MVTGELLYKDSGQDAPIGYKLALNLAQEGDKNNFLISEECQDFKEFLTYILPGGSSQLQKIFDEFDKWEETGETNYQL